MIYCDPRGASSGTGAYVTEFLTLHTTTSHSVAELSEIISEQ